MVQRRRTADSEHMLILVRDNETRTELEARRREQEDTVAAIAAAPVRHVSAEFLAAVEGLFPELVPPAAPAQRVQRQ